MGSEYSEFDEKGTQKISVSQQESFVIDMGGLTEKQRSTPNSRITLQRSFSRKMSNNQRSGEKKTVVPASGGKEEDNDAVLSSSSPRVKASMPKKPMTTNTPGMMKDQTINPQSNHHITIVTSNIGSNTTTTDKRFAFRRSSSLWAIDPRKILLLFATLSSMGTMVLIYLTLSVSKLNADDSYLN